MIYKFLKEPEKKIILNDLLGFDVDENGVVYDEEGDEFHGYSQNDKYDFKDLNGIVEYIKDQSFEKGISHNQREIKKALNI